MPDNPHDMATRWTAAKILDALPAYPGLYTTPIPLWQAWWTGTFPEAPNATRRAASLAIAGQGGSGMSTVLASRDLALSTPRCWTPLAPRDFAGLLDAYSKRGAPRPSTKAARSGLPTATRAGRAARLLADPTPEHPWCVLGAPSPLSTTDYLTMAKRRDLHHAMAKRCPPGAKVEECVLEVVTPPEDVLLAIEALPVACIDADTDHLGILARAAGVLETWSRGNPVAGGIAVVPWNEHGQDMAKALHVTPLHTAPTPTLTSYDSVLE